ncbi:hypothetical protein ACIGCP_19755 [Cellulophaga baltica]|uniref:hypothetical protein n=1 Tax=Cellulophaga baltica TaxID=76594 RepID=UPI0037C77A31
MKNKFTSFIILLVIIITSSCNEHDKSVILLSKSEHKKNVIFQTPLADFYFEKKGLIDYCKKENNGEPNDFTYPQIIKYITEYGKNPVIIPDTLGTKMEIEKEVMFNQSDSLIRVRDHEHPYRFITDDIRWAIISFAEKGKLRIFHKESDKFLDTIIIDKVDTDWYGETNITLTNDSIFFSKRRWIK